MFFMAEPSGVEFEFLKKYRETKLKVKCSKCGCWNDIPVYKLWMKQPSPEPKVRAFIAVYNPLKIVKCKKCGDIIAQPNELIRILRKLPESHPP
jgi:hypothetical protein